MKAYLTTVGEKTTGICKEQLERYGFEVVLLDILESWPEKYKRFIRIAAHGHEPCIRIDADVIVNENIQVAFDLHKRPILMAQFTVFDLYQNDLQVGQPVYYSAQVLQEIERNLDRLDPKRPETSAWRLPDVNEYTYNIEGVTGMHGFFQDLQTIDRAFKNKHDRRQLGKYDFDLVHKLESL